MKKYFLLIIALFLIPQTAYLQTAVEEQLSVDFSNNFPVPNETILVDIESYQTDLDKAKISWYVDGVLVEEGFGLKNFIFIAGDLGSETVLTIRITKQGGGVLEKKYYISPGEVNIYYEGLTVVPPFYSGRPEFSVGSIIKLVALPNMLDVSGRKIKDENVSYTWKINGSVDKRSSGVGKNVYYYSAGTIPRDLEVVVEASPINSNQTARAYKAITPEYPKISFYEKNPIYGTIFEQTVKNNFISTRDELEIYATPYGFSTDIFTNGMFEWKLNNKKSEVFKSNNIVFRKTEDGSSKNNVSLEIQHNAKVLQSEKKSFILNFSDSNQNFNF